VRISDSVVGAGFVVAGAAVFAATLDFPTLDASHPGPSLFPRIVATVMMGLGIWLAVGGLRSHDGVASADWRALVRTSGFVNALYVLGGTAAFVAFVERLGFLITGAVVLFVIMWRLRVPLVRALVVAVVFNTIVHFLFAKVLRVPLPAGILWW
jgi:putative tricarboxylic transport membrane protein